jgi:hypothetical protein
MEVLIRTHDARRRDGSLVKVEEYRLMVDHSLLRNGSDWVPGPKRFVLETGEGLRRIDDATFQGERTGDILVLVGR